MENKELVEKVMSNIIANGENPVITGFEDIDCTLATPEKNALIIIGGRPAMGKTAFIMAIFENLLKLNKRCLYINLESGSEMFIHRLLAQVAEVERHKLFTGLNNEIEQKLRAASEFLVNSDFSIESSTFKFNDIEEKIKNYKPEYVFIDYLQLIEAQSKKQRCDTVTDIMTNLKRVAQENNAVIFVSSQLSRAIESRINKRPMLCDLRESSSIEETADAVMFLYREEYYRYPDENDREYLMSKGHADVIIAKNKFGPMCTFDFLFNRVIPKFYEKKWNYEF